MSGPPRSSGILRTQEAWIALAALAGIAVHLGLRHGTRVSPTVESIPLWCVLAAGLPLLVGLLVKMLKREFGSDLLAGISIVTSIFLDEKLAGAVVVLMLSGGAALEAYAVERASSALRALASRLPAAAHRRRGGAVEDVPLEAIQPGDEVVVAPHESAPVDGVVLEGRSTMDESYLTGEPFLMAKTPGSDVISGAVNGEGALTIRAARRAEDSRYARILKVMKESEQRRPRLRRLGDRLGAWYTPLALAVAGGAALVSGEPARFLAVLVVATPCPLLIAIPVAIIGAISLAARRGIVIRNPAVLEQVDGVRTLVFDKTGTLTYGAPRLTGTHLAPGVDGRELLALVAGLERYSKHPLAGALQAAAAAEQVTPAEPDSISEKPGEGLLGRFGTRELRVVGRKTVEALHPAALPDAAPGLECAILLDGVFAALYRFHDAPRGDSRPFVAHLSRAHGITRTMLVSGDRECEVAWLAKQVGIEEVRAGQSPEQKVAIVREETRRAPTLFLGDGINDAPALAVATVGVAFGPRNDVAGEAAGAVIMEASLTRVDEFLHISRHLRRVALISAVGGMALSVAGMGFAAAGFLSPVAGALVQEGIDLFAVLQALRAARAPGTLSDVQASTEGAA